MPEETFDYAEKIRQESRLETLRFLSAAAEYTATDGLVHAYLVSRGLSCSHAAVRAILAWLNEVGLVVTQRVGGEMGVMMATVTESGMDAAAGRSRVPGVSRPRPGA